jgi:alanyl-tRNA synthetase
MMTAAEIRQAYLDFFKSKGHTIVPSAPIVVKNDPTLMFTNAGMNQFKDYFLGNKPAPWSRVADTQKCLRVSGKHNDLEEVGVDTYHHTMFEMLGNWSFGDYFKPEAIAWSWELLTEVYKIPVDRLYVSVFEGDEKENLPASKIALTEWQKIVADDHIVFGNKKDNFWEMGDTGPCGPCSEIHVDMRPEAERKLVPGKDLVNADHPQVIEIWNNVFMQYNRLKDGSLQPLPAQHVDTGMGFERLVRVIQGKTSNYDTDVFTGTIASVEKLSHKTYDFGDSKQAVAFRVIADHIRTICFAIADGQLPSNTGAGYVIRRILRRAVRYAYSYLDVKEPLLCKLVPVIGKQFEHVFPELAMQVDFVSKVVMEEELAFLRTLEGGLKRIDELIKQSTQVINGEKAFELFDTYGFPIDLTKLIASEHNLTIDEAGFNAALLQQKTRSRAATTVDAGDWVVLDDAAINQFVGYENYEAITKIIKYRKVTAKGQDGYQLVLERTPFYAESGGQVGDTGILEFGNEKIVVNNTKKDNDLIIHFTNQIPSEIAGIVTAKVDSNNRNEIAAHHTATHLLHAALRQVLGTHVAQKGSAVNEQQLRFDFSHFAKVTPEEIQAIAQIVNQKIRQNIPVIIKELPKEEALKLGAMALFGEKYGDMVRVVIIDPAYSVELCGGTHVGHTGQLGYFAITHETAVAAGVRRIEAATANAVQSHIETQFATLEDAKKLLKNPKDLAKAIEQLQQDNTELKKQIDKLEAAQLVTIAAQLATTTQTINNYQFIGEIVAVNNADALKKLCVDLKASNPALHAIILCASIAGKASVALLYADESGLDAGKTIKEHVAPLIKGGGGGAKNLATAGGQIDTQFSDVINKVKSLL